MLLPAIGKIRNGDRAPAYQQAKWTALPDLVTLSGHIFIDPFICEEKASPSNCQFTITNNGVVETAMMTENLGDRKSIVIQRRVRRLETGW